MARIITNGCFDIIHPGHYNLLSYCRMLAGDGELIVLIDDDSKVRTDKGQDRPVLRISERVRAVKSLNYGYGKMVDHAYIFYNDEDLESQIKKSNADILVKGADWEGKKIIGAEFVKQVKFFSFIDGYSTTSIIERIKRGPEWRKINNP